MPIIDVHVARIEFGSCSGMLYSYEPFQTTNITVNRDRGVIRAITVIRIKTPDDFKLEQVQDAHRYGDSGFSPMVFDPIETAKSGNGRVFVTAASLVERMRAGTGEFAQVG